MRVAAVVELAWDPVSIEADAWSGEVDRSRAVLRPVPGSLEAVELALSLGSADVFGLGPPAAVELLRECLAMGAGAASLAPDVRVLAAALEPEGYRLVLVPHRSGDQGVSPVAGLLAGLLDVPQATGVESLAIEDGEARVVARLDRGEREELAVPLPAVIAVEPGIVRPRMASPAGMVGAVSAPVVQLAAASGGLAPALIGHRPPRPAPPRMRAPDGALPAEARIAAVVGASGEGRQRELVTGSAEAVADRILQVLEAAGHLD